MNYMNQVLETDIHKLDVQPQADDDELSILGPLLDVIGNNGDVLEVQGGINLVHDVERSGLKLQSVETISAFLKKIANYVIKKNFCLYYTSS